MNHREKLLQLYSLSSSIKDIAGIPTEIQQCIYTIADSSFTQKGAYTVLVTLLVHKQLHPSQDIRYHQSNMPGGFSGRSIDTQYITPTLKELGLPSMAESGWLTRSLEQPFPYTLEYEGHISNPAVKAAFLKTIDYAQHNGESCASMLRLLFNRIIYIGDRYKVPLVPLKNPDKLTIPRIVSALDHHFGCKYGTHGGSKLPVLALYAIYQLLVNELKRYESCTLAPLGSHTASDRTSRTAGDIQVFTNSELFEAVEVKLDRIIDNTLLRIAVEKITRYNPKRYYILSNAGIKKEDIETVTAIIAGVRESHGCQIILNGVSQTIRYYLRLIRSLESFIDNYSSLVSADPELQPVHKAMWNEILSSLA